MYLDPLKKIILLILNYFLITIKHDLAVPLF